MSPSPNNVPLKHARTHARTHTYTPTQQPQTSTNTPTQHLSNNHPTCKNAERERLKIYTQNHAKILVFDLYSELRVLRFWDEDEYEYEISSILSVAHAWTSVILAGKSDSRHHSTTSFGANVVCWLREQVIKCFIISLSFSINNRSNFFCEKSKMELSGVCFYFGTRAKCLS